MSSRIILLAIASLCFQMNLSAQDEDFCGPSKNKKIKKIYEKLYERETTDQERFKLLVEAFKIDEYCTQCYYDFANLSFYKANTNNTSYAKAKEYFIKSIEVCPTYKADAYFHLATICRYEEERAEALEWIEKFENFGSDDPKRKGAQYDEKVAYLQPIKKDLEYWHKWHTTEVKFNPEPVKNVSSGVDEYLPMLSPDNELLYFSRKEKIGVPGPGPFGDYEEPLYLAYREDVLKDFDGGKRMKAPFDSDMFVGLGGVTISVDNHEMIICGCENIKVDMNGDGRKSDGEVYKNCDLFSTTYEKVYDSKSKKYFLEWTELQRLDDRINTPDGWEATPTLSGDGKTLYFAAIKPGKYDIDIYYSKRQEDGSWSRARKVKGINTNGDDKAPFMHADSKTMYFVSGPSKTAAQLNNEYEYEKQGAGGFDLYFSKQKKDGTWSTPTLMAKPINTPADELGLIVSTDGHWAYFSSSRYGSNGGTDIFRFELYEEAKPEKVKLLKGTVKDEKGNPDTEAVVEIKRKGSDEKVTTKVNDEGNFAVIIEDEGEPEDIIVTTKKKGHAPASKLITVEDQKEMEKKHIPAVKVKEMTPVKVKTGAKFTIQDIRYATASYDLTDHSKFVLDQFIEYLKENPTMRIEIQGHTDNEGIAAKNKVLSQNRADGVKAYMVSKGIKASRLTAKGFGQEDPKVPNTSAANKAQNRRTDFKVLAL